VPRSYGRPPITEAVIDFRVNGSAKMEDLERLSQKLHSRYPTKQGIQDVEIQVGAQNAVDMTPAGYRLASLDQADVCVLNIGGITTSRLAPYLGWESLEHSMLANWKAWRKIAGLTLPSRIGVRFINRIDVPVDLVDKVPITDYIRLHIEFPNVSDAPWIGFSTQLSTASMRPHWNVNLGAGLVSPPPLLGYISLLLDIDVWRSEEIPTAAKDQEALLTEARELKNELFEQFVTDNSRELFQ
jgi:uncharacterized protein (TIGR04255 family)